MDERCLLPVADQAPPGGRQPLAGDQRSQHGRGCLLVVCQRAPHLGVRMPRKSGCDLRRGPQRELGDHPHVRVPGQQLHHIGGESGAGRQPLPVVDDRIRREPACPFRCSRTRVEQGQGGIRPGQGIHVQGGQPAGTDQRDSALRNARRQGHRLRTAEVRTFREMRGDILVRDRDQPVDQLGRQGGIAGEPAQHMIHDRHPARTVRPGPGDFGSAVAPRAQRDRGECTKGCRGPGQRSDVEPRGSSQWTKRLLRASCSASIAAIASRQAWENSQKSALVVAARLLAPEKLPKRL